MDENDEIPQSPQSPGQPAEPPNPYAPAGEWMPPPPAPWVPPGSPWSQGPSGQPGPGGPTTPAVPGSGWYDPTGWGPPNHYGSPYSGANSGGWGPPSHPPTPSWGYGWQPPAPPAPSGPRRSLPTVVTVLLLVVAVLVGLGIGHGVWSTNRSAVGTNGNNQNPNSGLNPGGSGSNSGNSANQSSVAAQASRALVDINTSLSYQNGEAAGTGIVVSSDGVVLTNNHVIEGATNISVTDIGNGKSYPGTVVGYDRTHDIAVVKMQGATGLTTAQIGNSNKVADGDNVIGLGNAGGVGGTPSAASGVVTALNQSITASDDSNGTSEQLTGLIQTDANIQPGDSGGALVNSSGQVIGVDTAASSGFTFNSQGGPGYAIPINEALGIANQIRSGQATASIHLGPTAFLGVLVNSSSTGNGPSGASLSQVVRGGPADKAGLTSGDTITSLGGSSVGSPDQLTQLIARYHPGDRVEIGWADTSGQTHQGSVQLSTGPAQ